MGNVGMPEWQGCECTRGMPRSWRGAHTVEMCSGIRDVSRCQRCVCVPEMCPHTGKVPTNQGCVHTSGICHGFRDVPRLSGDVPCARDLPAGVTGREGGPMEPGPHSPGVWVGDTGSQRDSVLSEGWPLGTCWALHPHCCAWVVPGAVWGDDPHPVLCSLPSRHW